MDVYTDRARAFVQSFFEGTADARKDVWEAAQGAANYINELARQVDFLRHELATIEDKATQRQIVDIREIAYHALELTWGSPKVDARG